MMAAVDGVKGQKRGDTKLLSATPQTSFFERLDSSNYMDTEV